MKILHWLLFCCIMVVPACVYDNEKEMFPHLVIPDSSIRGQVAWFSFDSTLDDHLSQVDPLRFWGDLERGRDHNRIDSAALILDGVQDYLTGLIGLYDSLAISLWFLPMPNYNRAYLFDYGIGRFAAGLDAVTSATMPRFRIFLESDTAKWFWTNEIDYFFWHHMYLEIGDTIHPPKLYVDGYLPDTVNRPWPMHPLTDLLYLGRPYNADIVDTLMYRGYIDEIRIFNQFLTEEEIFSLYWEGLPGKSGRKENLKMKENRTKRQDD